MTISQKKRAILRGGRDLLGLTQTELGAEIGLEQSHVSEMETGARPIRKIHEAALEALLRREGKWPVEDQTLYLSTPSGPKDGRIKQAYMQGTSFDVRDDPSLPPLSREP